MPNNTDNSYFKMNSKLSLNLARSPSNKSIKYMNYSSLRFGMDAAHQIIEEVENDQENENHLLDPEL